MKNILVISSIIISGFVNAQIITNKEDISEKVEMFEVWAFKKPFSLKESYFINYGQDKFKPNNYDLVGQGIQDKEGKKFDKGEWLKLVQYLEKNGFYKQEERAETIGNVEGRIITFKKEKR
ncbi:hypothetical protein [Empedobacter brevis]|uniref:hypothetical protein n=1 Tax=Empedobacter brevis TaxID=247 RepID=UPI0028AC25CA|nr:hypothetical protein [Empedobacter brevis]